jgi:hypothetical protein
MARLAILDRFRAPSVRGSSAHPYLAAVDPRGGVATLAGYAPNSPGERHVAPEAADRMARALWHDEDQADDAYGGERTGG